MTSLPLRQDYTNELFLESLFWTQSTGLGSRFTTRCENAIHKTFPDIRNGVALFEGSQASPVCPSDKNIIEIKVVWRIVGMILSGEKRCAGGKTCTTAIVFTTVWRGLAWNRTGVRLQRLRNNSVPISQRTESVCITKTGIVILCRRLVAVYRQDKGNCGRWGLFRALYWRHCL
jgi:hypothetical protein